MTKKEILQAEYEVIFEVAPDASLTIAQLQAEIEKKSSGEDDDALLESVGEDASDEEVVEPEVVEESAPVEEVIEEPKEAVADIVKAQMAQATPVNQFKQGLEVVKAHLDKQEKQAYFIPLEQGETMGRAVKIVAINGFRFSVPKGEQVLLPQQIAQMITESTQANYQIVQNNPMRVGGDPTKINALT